jgi:glucokinase
MSNILGFDIGGTYIKYGVVDAEGNVLEHDKISTPKVSKTQGEELISLMKNIGDKFIKKYNCLAVGISAHGVVDNVEGIVSTSSYHLPSLAGLPIVGILSEHFDLPVSIDNDAKSAAIGEYWHGSASEYKNFIFVALGTSIGGAIIIDGKLLRGIGNCAGEIGYLITNEFDSNNDFVPGAWESYGSASSLMKKYKQQKGNHLQSDDFNKDLANGDEVVKLILDKYIYSLTSGLISLAHTLSPEAFVFGGGITKMGNKLLAPIKSEYQRRALAPVRGAHFKMAVLGNNAGMIGAAYLAKQKISSYV